MQRQRSSLHLATSRATPSLHRKHPSVVAYRQSQGFRQRFMFWVREGDAWAITVCILALIVIAVDGWLH